MFSSLLAVATLLVASDATRPDITGAVVDEKGQPVAGARIDIATAAPLVGRGLFCPSCYADCVKFARTGDGGEFLLESLDPTLKFRLLVSKPGKQAFQTSLVNPRDGKLTVTLEDMPADLPVERTVRGIVVNTEGKPIEGALVEPYGAKTEQRRWWGTVKGVNPTITDHEGKFVVLLPADFEGLDVEVTADGHCAVVTSLLAPGASQHRIPVKRGASVTGRLLRDGQPLAGAQVSVVQTDRSISDFDGLRSAFIKAVGATTGEDGRFEFHHLPPSEEFVLFSVVGPGPQEMVVTTTAFDAPPTDSTRDLGDVEAQPALKITGRVVLPEGETLPKDAKLVVSREPAWDLISLPIAEDGSFEIAGLAPETYELRVAADGWRLDEAKVNYQVLRDSSFGLRLEQSLSDLEIPLIKGEKKSPAAASNAPAQQAKLVPNPGGWISGRVLADGKPREGIKVSLNRLAKGGKARARQISPVTTDGEGRFRISGLETGDEYIIQVDTPQGFSKQPWRYGSPYVHKVADANQEIQLPDLNLVHGTQSLRGKVVDPQGNPQAGIQVSARNLDGNFIPNERNRSTMCETEADGSFSLTDLPPGELELFAYKHNPNARFIRFPVAAHPKVGQQDLRIVIDPSLLTKLPRFPD